MKRNVMLFEQWKSSKFSKLNEDDSLNGPPTADLANITIEEFFNMQPKAKSRFIMSFILSNINSNINQRITQSDSGSINFIEGANKLDFITWGRDLRLANYIRFIALVIPTTLQGWNAIAKKDNVKLGDNIGKLPVILDAETSTNNLDASLFINTKECITVNLAYIVDKFTKVTNPENLYTAFRNQPQNLNNINVASVMQIAAANAEKADPEWAAGLKDYKDEAKSYAGNKNPNDPEASSRSTTPASPIATKRIKR